MARAGFEALREQERNDLMHATGRETFDAVSFPKWRDAVASLSATRCIRPRYTLTSGGTKEGGETG